MQQFVSTGARVSTRRNVATAHDVDAHPPAALRLLGAPAAPDPATPEPTVRRDPGTAARRRQADTANAASADATPKARHGPLAVVARPAEGGDGSGGVAKERH